VAAILLILPFLFWLSGARPLFAAEAEKWMNEWAKTVEAAKKEGQLAAYGGAEISHPDIIAAFNKEYPEIKVTAVTGRAPDLTARILAERRADKYLADIIASGPNAPRTLYLAKALDPIAPALILPEVTDQTKWYGGKHWYADPENKHILLFEGSVSTTGISVNTKLMSPNEITSYWDMVQSKWKGKILAMDPRGAALPTPVLMLYYDPDVGPEFLKTLLGKMDITLFRDRSQGTNWLGTGKFPVCFYCRDIDLAQKQGLPIAEVPPAQIKEGATIGGGSSSVLALINKAPHPNAARVFINWYLSRQGQVVWQRVMNTKEVEPSDSMRTDIPKDDVLPEARRAEGRKYRVVGFLDPKALQQLLNEVLK
jgi:ABC-type Fe3+ transport system substrate-binding protein